MLTSDDKLSERFTQALQAGGRAWRLALERQLKACGLTPAGWSAIAALADMGRAGGENGASPPSQTELAQHLGVDSATLVATLDRLAAAGLVARNPSSHDRRVKLVVLTQQGDELAQKVRAQAEALRRGALARLDPGQVAAAAAVLEQLQQVLESP
jgi:MarR family transcriptional regulator for hemolysin